MRSAAVLLLLAAALPAGASAQSARLQASATVVAPLETVAAEEAAVRIAPDGAAELRLPAAARGPGRLIVSVSVRGADGGDGAALPRPGEGAYRVLLPSVPGKREASVVYHVATNN
jgi:hypothetical protein